jgi:uncharacterized membrane protein YgdD (TMEM256/DUF423 family)
VERVFLFLGAILGFLGVAGGAFGGHLLKERLLPEFLNIFEIGVRYQMYHALALLALAWAFSRFGNGFLLTAGWLFLIGTLVFSGSLYALSLTGVKAWGAVTPLGGLALLAGWILFAAGVISK